MYTLSRNCLRQSAMQITTMKRVIGHTESGLDRFAQRGAQQNTTIVPAPLDETDRLNAYPVQFAGNPYAMQNAGRIRPKIDTSADFAERFCLFVNLNVKSSAQQQGCRREATDAPANNCDRSLTCDRHLAA